MSDIIQFFEVTFGPLVMIFTISNLAVMGLQVKIPEVIAELKNKKAMTLIIVWGWVVGPVLGLLITWVLPLSEPFEIGLLLYSLAPCAPFLPVMVGKARGDVSFAAALVPIVAVGTVIFMPFMGPLMIHGLTISAWDLAKVLLLYILIPLTLGAALRYFADTAATKILPAVNVIAKITTALTPVVAIVIYYRDMLDTVGSFALLSMTIFMVVMGLLTYRFGFGLKQNQRSVMSLGMLTRNGSVVLIAVVAIPNVDPGIITYVIMFVIASFVVAAIAARIFGKLAEKGEADVEQSVPSSEKNNE
jgi:BASS family bile acid:Na+ symporter